ncbi:MAG TPA: heparin lyase I family protein [Stellaceae bacterium]|nr:heparin lyase I family protein [Stellaceae bacterium]
MSAPHPLSPFVYVVAGLVPTIRAGLVSLLVLAPTLSARAEPPSFAQDFTQGCATSAAPDLSAWRVSGALDPAVRPLRLTCAADAEGSHSLRIEVRPHDAYDAGNPGDNPTERAEMQIRRELVKFDRPVWYTFRFRLEAPWPGVVNRTVIHQIKQNIATDAEIERGGPCAPANPFFKIEAGYRTETGSAAFVTNVRGTDDCRDGKSPEPICGPWPLTVGEWHRVHVALKPSQHDGETDLRVWLDGRACAPFTGRLGYLDHGRLDANGNPVVDTQPRFGIYRDALPETLQAIDFADIAFWQKAPADDPAWAGLGLKSAP